MFHVIKVLCIFLYHFLFIDQNTGQISNTKFFANVGYTIWCGLFPYAVVHGSQAPMDLWLVFGAVVIGNRTLNVLMQAKAGVPPDPANTWKGVNASVLPPPDSTTTTTISQITDPTSVSTTASTTTVTATVPPPAPSSPIAIVAPTPPEPIIMVKPGPIIPDISDLV
jgi:hypothetical protein